MFTHRIDENLEIVLLESRHAEELYELIDANRDHLRRWLPWVTDEKGPNDSRVFIQSMLRQFAYEEGLLAGVRYQEKLAGTVSLHDINPQHGTAEIGYWLGAEYEGKGLMSKSCCAIIDYAFEAFNLNRIQIRIEPENTRSRAIPRRLGFHYEGTLRKVARGRDMELYSMLKEEWAVRRPDGE